MAKGVPSCIVIGTEHLYMQLYFRYFVCPKLSIETGVAQLVEHWSPKPGVGSSSLSSRANSPNHQNVC